MRNITLYIPNGTRLYYRDIINYQIFTTHITFDFEDIRIISSLKYYIEEEVKP